ncbi:COX16 cytochrome c oxidase assembly homolog isoform X1 [Rattus norvegicus]|uniref:COX16 cytochrome c oxidase assembly homolog isoform X1 n=1 Tax=Rattus norvegicus TaxID=10116 RepID=UPI0003D0958C|nr:COX16 cytochrome c oxidase assembly homolog isoform X1 [Rattus norvegicus]|eukprot:XP_006240360.1 PREDICTED: COX16 cytochrome c oxidase assembly homolog isoform X1 [Rattus norvegicus]
MVAPAVLRALRKNKTLRYGVPMLLLVVGGSFGLREFSQIRYDAVTIKIDPELEKKLKVNKITLESEYELARTWIMDFHFVSGNCLDHGHQYNLWW